MPHRIWDRSLGRPGWGHEASIPECVLLQDPAVPYSHSGHWAGLSPGPQARTSSAGWANRHSASSLVHGRGSPCFPAAPTAAVEAPGCPGSPAARRQQIWITLGSSSPHSTEDTHSLILLIFHRHWVKCSFLSSNFTRKILDIVNLEMPRNTGTHLPFDMKILKACIFPEDIFLIFD